LSVQSSCGSESKGYSLTAFAVSSDSQGKKQVACIILNVHLKCSGEDVDLNLFTGAMISQRRFLERFPTELLIQEIKWFLAALAESRIKWPNPSVTD
jgi:hypothetical protein